MKRNPALWVGSILFGLLTTLAVLAVTPSWWVDREVVLPGSATNDYSVINIGQLKNMASNAYRVLDATLPGGAGAAVSNLVANFSNDNNYAVANLGQLKAVAQPFYDRLIEVGCSINYPWSASSVGLLLHYTFDTNENGIVTDASGNGRTALVNGATWVADGARGGAYRFDTNTQTITASDAGLPSGDSPRTIAAWMKLDVDYPGGVTGILSYGTPSYNQQSMLGFDWRLDRDRFFYSQCGACFLSDHKIGAPGTWNHVAYTYGGYGEHHFYVDGLPSDGMSELGQVNTVLSGLLLLGGHPDYEGLDGGYLDDVRIYGRMLSGMEIAELVMSRNRSDFSAANIGQLKRVFSFDPDSDGDGMSDWWELRCFGDLNMTADGDVDRDGATNLAEFQAGTLPGNPDTDGDGMADGWELECALDPRDAADGGEDADNDGFINQAEYVMGSDPRSGWVEISLEVLGVVFYQPEGL